MDVQPRPQTLERPDGARLAAYRWRPERPRGAMVLVHGYAEHAQRHAAIAGEAARRDIDVWALDLRGHGRSSGARALVRGYEDIVEDVRALICRVHDEQPGAGVALFGHSMGGAVTLRLALDHAHEVDALVLSAPFLLDAAGHPGWLRAVARGVARLAPSVPVVGVDAREISRDEAEVARYREDPLIHHKGVPAATAVTLDAEGKALLQRASELRVPTLVLHGEGDKIAAVDGSRTLAETAPCVRLVTLPEAYHELHHEPPHTGVPERARGEALAWIERHVTDEDD
jgi:alpha-beta hydrolase superfamily lysophospholipase